MINWDKLGVRPADILLPETRDITRWGCVACDQFTSDGEYWDAMEDYVGDAPSTLRITFPEIYLGKDDEKYISSINACMRDYLARGIFKEYKGAIIKCERTLRNGSVRSGLVMAVDLEAYDYSAGSQSMIRATEGTIVHRLPPRIAIRKDAPLELPHIMILIDDPNNTVIGNVSGAEVYNTPLAMNGGSIKGSLLSPDEHKTVADALARLADQKDFATKYGLDESTAPLVYAMGDGNHSLACAKACWENLKKELSPEEQANHPARYALAEIVNLYDESLQFEPIHRVVFDVDAEKLISEISVNDGVSVTVITENGEKTVTVKKTNELAVGSLQDALDAYMEKNGGRIDYIHEPETVAKLGSQAGNVGFILPEFDKSQLFPAVISSGALPRKTFSMGEGCDKRYYFEARRIKYVI
ncbi:MAG: DUF1015 domain-containing protein [Clostridia bacterium]|nr:DUF1015 domain-containing protein [Clostridia bacterium]